MEAKSGKRQLHLDWEQLMPNQEEDPQIELIIKPSQTSATTATPSQLQTGFNSDKNFSNMTDDELEENIKRYRHHIQTLSLVDKGKKLHDRLKLFEEEEERRKRQRIAEENKKEADGCENRLRLTCSSSDAVCNGFREDEVAPAQSNSTFASTFCKKMGVSNSACRLSARQPMQKTNCHIGEFSWKGREKMRQVPSKYAVNLSEDDALNDDRNDGPSSTFSRPEAKVPSSFAKGKYGSQLSKSKERRSKKGETIVLVDEDESHDVQEKEQLIKLDECMKGSVIYYPTRDDPQSVEICWNDIDCLAPEEYLKSTIMNFYIRYLQEQASLTGKSISDYHFFNTYFYEKLKEAVCYKRGDRDAFFERFRRWWKRVNIFQKAYILIPIHEGFHWSLVIICIPAKEEESGPIVLHLDSLGLHYSKSIFDNIKSFISKEWNYLEQEGASSDIPIVDRVWNNLSRRIVEKKVMVPQQKNVYDCGLFVLFFIERFINSAPQRLKKDDLAMFGKQWFKPEEASGLRIKIQNLLQEEFEKACQVNCDIESSPLSVVSMEENIDSPEES